MKNGFIYKKSFIFTVIVVFILYFLWLGALKYDNTNKESNYFALAKSTSSVDDDSDKATLDDSDDNVETQQKEEIKGKKEEIKEKTAKKFLKKIENDSDFWNYLKQNQPKAYENLQYFKTNDEELYKYFTFRTATIYYMYKKTENQNIKKLLEEKMSVLSKEMSDIIDYKQNKIDEKTFETNMKDSIRRMLDIDEKIMTERLNEFKAKKEEMTDKIYQKVKEKVSKK